MSRRAPHRSLVPALLVLLATPAAADDLQAFGRRLSIGPQEVLVLADPAVSRVALFDVAGETPRTIGETGTAGDAPGQWRAPHGAALDARGELVVADTFHHRLQRYDVAPLRAGG